MMAEPTTRNLQPTTHLTLGILAGGRATRLNGLDKAWLQRDGVPQVLRIARQFQPEVSGIIVSANRDLERYIEHGLHAVPDRITDAGPIGGLDALAHACRTEWLLTVPVDLIGISDCLSSLISGATATGAFAEDDDGPQPLVALWHVPSLRTAIAAAMTEEQYAVHDLQSRLNLARVRMQGVRFGNLNTPADLDNAGIV